MKYRIDKVSKYQMKKNINIKTSLKILLLFLILYFKQKITILIK